MTTTRHALFVHPALITATLLLLALPAHSQPDAAGGRKVAPAPTVEERLDQLLFAHQRLSFDLGRLADEAGVSGRIELDLEGFTYEILLQPNDLRAPSLKRILTTPEGVVEETLPPLATYRGTVAGEADSDVRLIVQPDLFAGYVRIGKRLFFVEPLAKFASGAPFDQLVVYSQDDVRPEAHSVCGLHARRGTATQLLDKGQEDEPGTKATGPRIIQIATEADGEFYQRFGGSTNSWIEGRINELDGIYRQELNLTFRITFQNAFTNPNTDPYSNTVLGHYPCVLPPEPNSFCGTSSGTCKSNCVCPATQWEAGLWDQFQARWNAQMGGVVRDVALMFSGKDLRVCAAPVWSSPYELFGTAGVQATVCAQPQKAYVLMEEYPVNSTGLMAHEIGHTLNAVHDDGLSSCNPGGAIGPIMCNVVEAGSNTFSTTSKNTIASFVQQSGSCLTPVQLCQPGANTLCLRNNRFKLQVTYVNGGTSSAKATPYSDQSGFFWFLGASNLEVGAKILGPVSGKYWLFHGGLTSFEYRLTVTDTHTGIVKTYVKPASSFCGGTDLGTFPALVSGSPWADKALPVPLAEAGLKAACTPNSTTLCLLNDRFKVQVLRSGTPQNGVEVTSQSGAFWFGTSDNVEIVAKVLDGTPVNGHFWFFWGALSNQAYSVVVTDTATGLSKSYVNPQGTYCGGADTSF